MPSNRGQRASATPRVCQWVNQADALEHFVLYDGPTQSQQHIKRPIGATTSANVYSAPDLKSKTRRLEWSPGLPGS